MLATIGTAFTQFSNSHINIMQITAKQYRDAFNTKRGETVTAQANKVIESINQSLEKFVSTGSVNGNIYISDDGVLRYWFEPVNSTYTDDIIGIVMNHFSDNGFKVRKEKLGETRTSSESVYIYLS